MKRFDLSVPVKTVNGEQWGELSVYALAHEFCGEDVKMKKENFTFAGGHRVRLYSFKKNVHWKIPVGQELNISDVTPENAPRRQAPRNR